MRLCRLLPLVVIFFTLFCLKSATTSLVRLKGNHTIAVLTPVHSSAKPNSQKCSNDLDLKRAVQIQALIYAVGKINSQSRVMESATLGFDVEDICSKEPEHLLKAMIDVSKQHSVKQPSAFFIDLPELLSSLVEHKADTIPVFSIGSHPVMKNKDIFYLEARQPRLSLALVKLLQKLNWTIFDIFVANNSDYQLIADTFEKSKICQNRIFSGDQSAGMPDSEDEKYPLLVLSESLRSLKDLPSKLRGRNIVIASEFLKMGEPFEFPRTLAIRRRPEHLDELKEFVFKSAESNVSWLGGALLDSKQYQNCAGEESCWSEILAKLSDEVRHGGKVIDAVYTIAHALNESRLGQPSADDILSMSKFISPTGNEISFTAEKYLSEVQYDIYNLAKSPAVSLGKIQTFPSVEDMLVELSLDDRLQLNTDTPGCLATCTDGLTSIPSPGKFFRCCVTCPGGNSSLCREGFRLSADGRACVQVKFDYLRWKHPLSIAIIIFVVILFCLLLLLINLFHKKAQTSTLLTSKLATLPLLLSLFITLIHPLLPIIKPSATSCNVYVFGFIQAIAIPLCILISRSHSLSKRFRNEDGSLKRKICFSDPQSLIAVSLIFFGIILSIVFVAVLPAHVVRYDTAEAHVDYIECSTFSGGEFLFPFFYAIILSLVFTVKNFGAETQEDDVYESHFTAIFFFGFYVLSFFNIIVVYGVIGKVKIMLICVLGILYLLNFLAFIFFPKVYVIIFKRDLSRFSPFPLNSGKELLIFDLSEQSFVREISS